MDIASRRSIRRPRINPVAEGVVCAPIVNQYLRMCEAQGIPREHMLAASGVSESDLNPPDTWVRQEIVERLFHGRFKQWPDPLLGLHFADTLEPARAGMLGFMALSCPSFMDMHNTLREFGRLASDIFSSSLIHEPGHALWCIEFRYTDADVTRHSTEWVLAGFATLARRLDPRVLLEVHMSHAPFLLDGKPHPDYARTFSCPVQFNQKRSALVLDPLYINKPSPNGDPLVFETLCQQARLLLEQISPRSSIKDRVKQEIRILLAAGHVSRDEVCQRIGISSRHLHRQLQLLDCSYQTLLDELRVESARQQVARPDADLNDISAELGFGSAKSFARWFATKVGATPAEYRRSTHGARPPL